MDEREREDASTRRGWRWGLALTAGVLLPLMAVAVELEGEWVGSLVASPMPTWGHVLLLLMVIGGNVVALFASPELAARRSVVLLNGVTLGVSGLYALAFLPLMPLSLIGIVFYGIGLLGFAPIATFLSALWLRRRLRRLRIQAALAARPSPPEDYRRHPEPEPVVLEPELRGTLTGVAAGLALLFLLEVPPALTHLALERATSADPAVAATAVERLRVFGDDEVLIAACHGRRHRSGLSLLLSGSPPTPQEARTVYYRVHGDRCPAPEAWGRGARFFRGGAFDEDQGGDRIGGRLDRLSLTSSRIDGSIDGDAALGYVEWTLAFRNDDDVRDVEARALIALPPGGVISRATLWIDGEEREAAFGGRGTVKAAYRRVVQRQRDPLLVTSAGPDRALVQCFLIAPSGGEMKIRVGVTFPLQIVDEREASAALPRLLAHNFAVAASADERTLWIESDEPLRFSDVAPTPSSGDTDGPHRLRRADVAVDDPGVVVALRATAEARAVASDPFRAAVEPADAALVEQWIEPSPSVTPARVVVVVDTSAAMAEHARAVHDALAKVEDGTDAALVLVGEGPHDLVAVGPTAMDRSLRDRWQQALGGIDWEGGRDNVPALNRAWDLAAAKPGAVVLWIHAGQAVSLSSTEALVQRWDRQPDGPRLIHAQAGSGEHVVVAALYDQPRFEAVARRGALEDDLVRQLAAWTGGETTYQRRYRRFTEGATQAAAPPREREANDRTSAHLVRLWAHAESEALRRRGEAKEATELAVRYQLVTPLSGAVVLETARQYGEAGLQPVDGETVPTVPEPETWALLIVMAVALLLFARQQRQVRAA